MRLKNCFFTVLLLLSSNSFAETSASGFLPLHLADRHVQEATVSFQVLRTDGRWERCAGAIVSDEGHIITANHCLDQCSDGLSKGPRQDRPERCIAEIDGHRTIVDVKVTSHCSFREHMGAALGKGPAKCNSFNDVAIVVPRTKLPPRPCLPVAMQFKEGEAVYTIGHPVQSRRGKNDSDGRRLYSSFGEIIRPQDQCVMVQNGSSVEKEKGINQPGSSVRLEGLQGLTSGTIQTTVDLLPGNSGGPLVNERGEVIAIASFIEGSKNNFLRECRGATFFSPVSGIHPTVSKISSGFDVDQLICKRKFL